jgi:hypothetical protein
LSFWASAIVAVAMALGHAKGYYKPRPALERMDFLSGSIELLLNQSEGPVQIRFNCNPQPDMSYARVNGGIGPGVK